MTNTTGQIDNIMFEMEEMNLIPMMKGDFNIVNEMRSHFGEEKFLDFLKLLILCIMLFTAGIVW